MMFLRQRKNNFWWIKLLAGGVCAFLFLPFFASAYTAYAPGQTITVGDFVYDDDYTATSTNCYVSIWGPAGSTEVNNAAMTEGAGSWYSYNYSSTTLGTFPAQMTCGYVGDNSLLRQDKTFIIATSTSASIETASSSLASVINANTNSASSSIASVINANTNTIVTAASSSLGARVSSIISSIASLPADVWSYTSRTLSNFGTLVADVWSSATRTLTGAGLNSGSLATQSDIQTASSSIVAEINANGGSGISLSDLQAASSSIAAVVNANTNSAIQTASTSIAAVVNANTNAASTSLGTSIAAIDALTLAELETASSSIASVVNANTNTIVTAASSSLGARISSIVTSIASLPADIWAFSGRTLTSFGTLVADVWSSATRTLTGAGLNSGSLATQSDIQTASSSIVAEINANGGSGISLSDLQAASSSIAAVVNANTNTQANTISNTITTASSSLAAVINSNTNSAVAIASSSIGSAIGNISAANEGWTVTMSDFSSVLAGNNYRARVTVVYGSTLTAPNTAPSITIYDASRNTVVSGVAMTLLSTGVYEYVYSVSGSAGEGTWEAVVSTGVETGKTIQTNDYWDVVTAPAQVLIQSMGSTETPNISANVRITNEGSVDYEYQYEWCVVTSLNNACGGGNDTYYGSAAKLIDAGDDFDTTLTATVPLAGTYYFKTVVYFGTDSSGASRQFTATAPAGSGSGGSGSGGSGSGGSGSGSGVSSQSAGVTGKADLNGDAKTNGIDFSILLAFWKSAPPFKNPAVDLNKDGKVDSVDFSILLFNWGK